MLTNAVEWEREERGQPRTSLWLAILALAGGLAGGGWYVYSHLSGHDHLLAQLKNWPDAVTAVREQVAATQQRLAELPEEIHSLRDRVAGFDRKLASGLGRAQESTRDLGIALRTEIASARKEARDANVAQEGVIEARFRELDAARRSEAAHTAQLEQEVAQMNARLAGVGDDVDSARISAAHESEQLRKEIRRTGERVTQVAGFNNRARERFEASRGKTQEIAPGMLLRITRTDPRYRRFDGWLQLVNDNGRFLWLRDQGMLQPVAFHAGKSGLQHDLVVTNLTKDGVTGYVIFPQRGELDGQETVSSVASGGGE